MTAILILAQAVFHGSYAKVAHMFCNPLHLTVREYIHDTLVNDW
jgi:hypothetical protein